MAKTIVITGSSTGLGAALAVKFAKAGHTVYATMRNLDKAGDLRKSAEDAGVDLKIIALDVGDPRSVSGAIEQVIEREGGIDVLVNNAGAGFVRTTEQATEADIQWIMDVNFMGVVRCTKAVLPFMRKARGGHIINISSVGGLVGQPFNEIYCAAKFAVEGYTEALASYVTPAFGIKLTAVEPGGIQSEFSKSALSHFTSTGGMLEDEYKPLLIKYVSGAQARAAEGVFQSASEVAAVVLAAIENPEPPIRLRTSSWAEDFCSLKTSLDPDGKKLQDLVFSRFLG